LLDSSSRIFIMTFLMLIFVYFFGVVDDLINEFVSF
jgi:hypothetical protein